MQHFAQDNSCEENACMLTATEASQFLPLRGEQLAFPAEKSYSRKDDNRRRLKAWPVFPSLSKVAAR
jgi:hypothetical protein